MISLLLAAAVSCAPTATVNPIPSVVGPMAGTHPVWLIDGSAGRWSSSSDRVKSLWVFARDVGGPVRIRGRHVGAAATLLFQKGMDGPIVDTLEIEDPGRASVIPGGASAAIMKSYAFIPLYLIYPLPGCWELDIQVGSRNARIVVDLKPEPNR